MVINGESKLIAAAFVKARGDMSATVTKDAKGNYGKYVTLAAIVEAITPSLTKHGLAMVQEVSTDETGLCVESWLVHESGATMQFTPLVMPLSDKRPQAVGSAATYARRYALAAICGLAPDDDDGQAAQDAHKPVGARSAPPQGNHPKVAPQTPTGPEMDDALFDQPTPERASKEQLKKLDDVGRQFYGDEWPEQLPKLVEAVSKGATSNVSELLPIEATKLIDGITKKMAQLAQVNGTAK